MSDETREGGLHIDSDWKEEAAREKDRLAEQEQHEQAAAAAKGATGEAGGVPGAASFVELVNTLAFQAMVVLGGMQGPGGEQIPANPMAAKHYIDLIEILKTKTEGNLTDEESRMLSGVLHELRMHYVQTTTAPPPPTGKEPGKA